MTEAIPILLVGAGGHARACIDVVEQEGKFAIGGLIGTPEEVGSHLLGYPVLGTDADLFALRQRFEYALVTTGQIKTPALRIHLFNLLQMHEYAVPTVVSPRAYVSPYAKVGAGTIVMHGAIVNAGAIVGRNCILNSQALVEHDVNIQDHCHISTATQLNGGVHVGAGTFVGSGTTIREGIRIGERCLIGMGQKVLCDCGADTRMPSAKRSRD